MKLTPTKSTEIVLWFTWDDAFEDVHASWHRDVILAERAHRRAADRLSRRQTMLAALLVMLTLLVAAGAFASVRLGPEVLARAGVDRDVAGYAVAAAALLAALLAMWLTLAGYGIGSERHRVAAIRYGSLERQMAGTSALPRHARPQPDLVLNDVRDRMDQYEEECPPVPTRLRRGIAVELEREPSPTDVRHPASVLPVPEIL